MSPCVSSIPLALLSLRITGSCTVTIPEWLFDRDCPGHYMRRIKNVSLSDSSVVGSFTSINCTLSLQSSTVRVSPLSSGGVLRPRHHAGRRPLRRLFRLRRIIVTSGGTNDSGMFETNLEDEPVLALRGRRGNQHLEPVAAQQLRTFDYTTISDFILHMSATLPGRQATRSAHRRPRNWQRCSTPRDKAGRRCCSACAMTFPQSGQRS